jgi:hypothetical protein
LLIQNFKNNCTANPNTDYGTCGSQDRNGDGRITIFDVANAVGIFKKTNCGII